MKDKISGVQVFSIVTFLISFLLLRFSNFSSSTIVNFYNHLLKSAITTGSYDTFGALNVFFTPFYLVFLSLIFFCLAVAFMAVFGLEKKESLKLIGIPSAVIAFVILPSISGIFIALAVLFSSFYAPRIAPAYLQEFKKWPKFRTGSNTAGKVLLVVNILITLGVFFTVVSSQSAYAASYDQELRSAVREVLLSSPTANQIDIESYTDRAVDSITRSDFFSAYNVWLPVTTALSAWFILELLRNIILSNLCGIFTSIILRNREKK